MDKILGYLKNQLEINRQRKEINDKRIQELEIMINTLEKKESASKDTDSES